MSLSFRMAALLAPLLVSAAAVATELSAPPLSESLRREAVSSLDRGVAYLLSKQDKDGSWSKHPAVTALCAMALRQSQRSGRPGDIAAALAKARTFMLSFVQPDGSIWPAGWEDMYPNYTTSIVLSALACLNHPDDQALMRRARKYLLDSQLNERHQSGGRPDPVTPDNDCYGGIGYGKSGPKGPDLSNTQWALEAIHLTEHLDIDSPQGGKQGVNNSDLAWKDALVFLGRLQNLPESNRATWVCKGKNDPSYGGFIYKPGDSKAGADPETKTLRSYGSMTYAGLKSMVYAKLGKDDPRVKAAADWAARHYTLAENPNIGADGHYYYLNTFAKAMAALGEEEITLASGEKRRWREDLVQQLLKTQKGQGEWFNEKSGRWWESSPELVTAYSILALELALGKQLTER